MRLCLFLLKEQVIEEGTTSLSLLPAHWTPVCVKDQVFFFHKWLWELSPNNTFYFWATGNCSGHTMELGSPLYSRWDSEKKCCRKKQLVAFTYFKLLFFSRNKLLSGSVSRHYLLLLVLSLKKKKEPLKILFGRFRNHRIP